MNRGDVLPIAEEAKPAFTRDGLLREACARLGVDAPGGEGARAVSDFGDDHFLEPLDVLVAALEAEAQLTLLGRWITRRFLLRLLEARLQMTAYMRADPGVLDEEIREPLFVAGAPRTGTTILYALLVEDRAHCAPRGWSSSARCLRPIPTPTRSRPTAHPACRPRAAAPRDRGRRPRRDPCVRRAPAQGRPVVDVVRVPV